MATAESQERRFVALERKVTRLSRQIDDLRKQQSVIVPISTLAAGRVALKRDIQVVVQREDDEYIATFFDANISASGESDVEAVDALKEIMCAKFLKFSELGQEKLGRQPARQLEALKAVMELA